MGLSTDRIQFVDSLFGYCRFIKINWIHLSMDADDFAECVLIFVTSVLLLTVVLTVSAKSGGFTKCNQVPFWTAELRGILSLLDYGIGSSSSPLHVVNPVFDYVPPELISLFVTDM